jgi:hypothetical protein
MESGKGGGFVAVIAILVVALFLFIRSRRQNSDDNRGGYRSLPNGYGKPNHENGFSFKTT